MTDIGTPGPEVGETSTPEKPAETLNERANPAATVTALSADQTQDHATEAAQPSLRCKCGAGQHAEKPYLCANHHQWPGAPAKWRMKPPEDDPFQNVPLDTDATLATAGQSVAALVQREVENIKHDLLRPGISRGRKGALREDLAKLTRELAQLVKAMPSGLIDVQPLTIEVTHSDRQSVLKFLPDCVIKVLASREGPWTDAQFLKALQEAGAIPRALEIELTDVQGPAQPIGAPAPAQSVEKPSEPVLERVPIPIEALGEETSPRLVKGAQTAPERPRYRTWFTEEGCVVAESEYMPPGPVGR